MFSLIPYSKGSYKLGKTAPSPHPLKLSKYLTAALPTPPDSFSWIDKSGISDWGMMKNDTYGDCVWAAHGHLIMADTAASGSLIIPSDDAILQAYASTGFDPTTGANDNGTNELDSLKFMQATGIQVNGSFYKYGPYVSIDITNWQELNIAIWLFRGAMLGAAMPLCAQGEPDWDYPPDDNNQNDPTPGSWGGHGIPALDYYSGGYNVITWGQKLSVNIPFWEKYIDEAWAKVPQRWIDGTEPVPDGFNLDQLLQDFNAL